jgi:Cu-Zn family superoxide dismutase
MKKHSQGALMIRSRSIAFGIFSATFLLLAGCQHAAPQADAAPPAPAAPPAITAIALVRPSQAATTQPLNNNVSGTITFTQTADGVTFVADIDGFAPETKHGFHIHDKGDLSAPNLSSAGGHFNPTSQPHGGPDSPHHHLGDLGNLEANANGHAHLEGTVKDVTLTGEGHSIVGKSVIIHAKTDDLKSQPAGESGGRIAGGVITLNQ